MRRAPRLHRRAVRVARAVNAERFHDVQLSFRRCRSDRSDGVTGQDRLPFVWRPHVGKFRSRVLGWPSWWDFAHAKDRVKFKTLKERNFQTTCQAVSVIEGLVNRNWNSFGNSPRICGRRIACAPCEYSCRIIRSIPNPSTSSSRECPGERCDVHR